MTIPGVRTARTYFAGVVFGATLAAAPWLYSYRVWDTFVTFDPRGQVDTATRVRLQPWWSAYGAVALILIGAGVSVWLLPEGRRLVGRFVARLSGAASAKRPYQ